MPYKIRYLPKKKCYSVVNPLKKKVFSKCTTKKNAVKQTRLLRALQFNKSFVPNSYKKSGKKRVRVRVRTTRRK